jgi:S1-C subfamily serine protease
LRFTPFVVLALACALVGATLALALGRATGWTDSASGTTIIRPAPVVATKGATKALVGTGFDPQSIYASRSPGVVTILVTYDAGTGAARTAQGSGFVVSPAGYILTNSHVITTAGDGSTVRPADEVVVEFQDLDRTEGTIVGWDVFDDVGVIKVDPSEHVLAPVPLGNSARVTVGEPVAAIGSPFGNENSLAVGVVSATKRSINSLTSTFRLVDAIQTDAPINHGNSGGPLFDAEGRVIGINAQIRSESGDAEGVGFAVPINSAKRSMKQLVEDGSVSYAFVGVETQDLIPSLARQFGYPVLRGAIITDIVPGSPAAAAGLRAGSHRVSALGAEFVSGGDVIVAIDGQAVRGSEDIARIVTKIDPGHVSRFTIRRGSATRQVEVRLAERDE